MLTYDDLEVTWNDRLYTYDGDLAPVVVPPVPPTPFVNPLIDALKGSHTPIARLEFLGADLNSVLYTVEAQFLNGSVTTDRTSDTYSSGSIEVVNDNGSLAVDLAGYIWPDRPVRVSRGAIVDGAPILVPLITGIVTEPKDGMATGSVGFSIASRFTLAQRQFPVMTTIAAGTTGKAAIRALLELGGFGTADTLYDLDDGGYIVPVDRTFATNDEILGSAIKWSFDMTCDLWPTGAGVAKMRPANALEQLVVAWDFADENEATLVNLGHSIHSARRYNRQTVTGRGPDGYDVSATAVISNPADPLFWSESFDLPAPDYFSADLADTTSCVAVAERLLFENATYEEAIEADTIPIPLVSAGDLVSFSGAGYADSYLLDSASIPVYKGVMRMQTRKVRSVTV